MKVEIWSDVVCPWCYIGKRRFEEAVAAFPDEVEVTYRSFELDPTAPVRGGDRSVVSLARRYGGAERVAQMQAHLRAVGAELGLDLRLDETWHVNTVDAHRLLHLALDTGGLEVQGELQEALMRANFEQVRDVSDPAVLREIAIGVGLPEAEVDDVLAGDRYRGAVAADVDTARAYGATGVPFFVLEGRYAVSGAQPTEVFARVLEQVWEASRSAPVGIVASGTGDVCGPEGCA